MALTPRELEVLRQLLRAVLPLFVALAAGVLLIPYVPWLSTGMLSLKK